MTVDVITVVGGGDGIIFVVTSFVVVVVVVVPVAAVGGDIVSVVVNVVVGGRGVGGEVVLSLSHLTMGQWFEYPRTKPFHLQFISNAYPTISHLASQFPTTSRKVVHNRAPFML